MGLDVYKHICIEKCNFHFILYGCVLLFAFCIWAISWKIVCALEFILHVDRVPTVPAKESTSHNWARECKSIISYLVVFRMRLHLWTRARIFVIDVFEFEAPSDRRPSVCALLDDVDELTWVQCTKQLQICRSDERTEKSWGTGLLAAAADLYDLWKYCETNISCFFARNIILLSFTLCGLFLDLKNTI